MKIKLTGKLLTPIIIVAVLMTLVPLVSAYESHMINVRVTVEQPTCVVIIDEDTIDNNMSTIEAAAADHGTTSEYLVNDPWPTETENPWLNWNIEYPGDVVLLPGGRVKDEGMFTLPLCIQYADDREHPYPTDADFFQAFIAGTVPQEYLDKILGVKPLRNYDLRALVGRTCIAVVYDSDISINYDPMYGNLQGARYGLFYFTTLGTKRPGSIPESTSSTSLLDIWVRVEPVPGQIPGIPTSSVCPLMEQLPDTVQITKVVENGGWVDVWATSDGQDAILNVSIGDANVLEEPSEVVTMDNPSPGYYEAFGLPGNPGDTITVSSDLGGSYTVIIPQ